MTNYPAIISFYCTPKTSIVSYNLVKQEVSLDPEVNGAREGIEKVNIGDAPTINTGISSPIMEEV